MTETSQTSRTKTIPITFDKSHLIVIGERLYAQSLELIRELVSNAYDADATHVWIDVDPYTLKVKDNGSGMDEAGLVQFFHIGSQEKRFNRISPVYKRQRIGEFGIGKFSVLSACQVFKVLTQRDQFAAEVVFDKAVWNAIDTWEIPLHPIEPNPFRGNGTTVVLERLTKTLTLPDIERFIRERVPLKAPNFLVYLNGKRIEPTIIHGKRFPVSCMTSFGEIRGEIILTNLPLKNEERGIECFVRGVFIKRETFGFEYGHSVLFTRLTGELHADFVPITSDRNRFMTDTPEYQTLYRIMRIELQNVMKKLNEQMFLKEAEKADSVLKKALSHIRKALKKNPEFAPETQAPVASADTEKASEFLEKEQQTSLFEQSQQGEEAEADSETSGDERDAVPESSEPSDREHAGLKDKKKPSDSRKIRIRAMNGREITARKMQLGTFSIVCRVEQLGPETPPSVSEAGVIFINRDHPLYQRFVKNEEALTLYMTELISQEIARNRATDVGACFALQTQILTDAWG